MSETSFGLRRSETDCIEITCNGGDSAAVHSDRLVFPSKLSGVLSTKEASGDFRQPECRYWGRPRLRGVDAGTVRGKVQSLCMPKMCRLPGARLMLVVRR